MEHSLGHEPINTPCRGLDLVQPLTLDVLDPTLPKTPTRAILIMLVNQAPNLQGPEESPKPRSPDLLTPRLASRQSEARIFSQRTPTITILPVLQVSPQQLLHARVRVVALLDVVVSVLQRVEGDAV